MSTILLLVGTLLAVTSTSLAMMIDGEQMSIDDAIIKAGSNGSMSKMFDIMQDKNTVMVELDMLYKMDTYSNMRKDMKAAEASDAAEGSRKKRKATRQTTYRWTRNRVPYEISYEFSSRDRQLISQAINDYHRFTCIRFVPASGSDTNRVRFQNGGGCSSYVGMIGRTQPISLAPGCRYKGIIIHEMGHAIGFQHEQTRPDRDSFVFIQNGNIQNGVAYNFMRYSTAQVNNHGVAYDYTSVMHYSQRAFSRNGQPTIVARDRRFQNAMGNREGLSFKDIELANKMYNCAQDCGSKTCSQGFLSQGCKCLCDSGDRSNPVKECDGTVVTSRPGVSTPRPTTAAPMRCQDGNQYCSAWKDAGFCTGQYQTYMRATCQYSCGTCQLTTTTTTTMATPPIANCVDNNRYCTYWAQRGECEKSPMYMGSNCKRACNACGTEKPECRDMNTNCPGWATRGFCSDNVYKSYLEKNCMRSCNVCTASDVTSAPETTSAPTEISSSCKDTSPSSDCESVRHKCSYMPMVQKLCAKTCGQC